MLSNVHLAAITKERHGFRLLQVPLHQSLQAGIAESWGIQYDDFAAGIERVEFNPGYQPEAHERFQLLDYEPPAWLTNQHSSTIEHLDPITSDDRVVERIAGTVAMARDDDGNEVMLFQNFTRAKIIRPGHFLFLDGNTYTTVQRPGLTLDRKLSAVYQSSERELLFDNFRTVNTFLPLAEYYSEASDQEIRDVLRHEVFAAEDEGVSVSTATQWFRKRMGMLRDSCVLDQFSVEEIRQRSDGHDVSIELADGKIVFPSDKAAAKRLLQFLNEEIYRGPITATLYETNSKKQAGP